MTLRCAIYARVSTDLQREANTIASQLRLLPEHATKQGWTIVETYVDNGFSGETIEGRPAFVRLMLDASERLFDVVLVIDLDRLSRSKKSEVGAVIYDQFRENKVKLATPSQGLIDLDDEDQDLLAGIKREMSKWEKRKIVARMHRGKVEAARQGRRFGSIDPYGLVWTPDPSNPRGGAYLIVPDEAAIVRRMYDLGEQGMGTAMIAWTLTEEGHRTRPMKRKNRPGGSGPWPNNSVRKILRSTTYYGEFRTFKGADTSIVIPVAPIITRAQWDRVQTAMDRRVPDQKWQHSREYLLSGLARCGVCGSAMWVVNARPGHGKHSYYRCSSTNAWRKMRMSGPCGNKHHRTDRVDALVWGQLAQVLADPELLSDACSVSAKSKRKGVDWEGQAEAAQRKLSDLDRDVAETLRRSRRGLLTTDACDQALEEIAKERRLLERNLKVAETQLRASATRSRTLKDLQSQAEALSRAIQGATFDERRKLIQLIVPTSLGGSVTLGQDGSIDIEGALPMPTEALPLRLRLAV